MAARYEIPLSPHGRLKLREPFVSQNKSVVLTNHIRQEQHCLLGFSPACWLKFLKKFARPRGRTDQMLNTFFVGGAHELALDMEEILIPPPLLKWAGLKERVTLLEVEDGVNSFELWDPARLL